jgi:hypothetical protein
MGKNPPIFIFLAVGCLALGYCVCNSIGGVELAEQIKTARDWQQEIDGLVTGCAAVDGGLEGTGKASGLHDILVVSVGDDVPAFDSKVWRPRHRSGGHVATLDLTYFELPDELRAKRPAEAAYLVLAAYAFHEVGVYTNGVQAFYWSVDARVLDMKTCALIGRMQFQGDAPGQISNHYSFEEEKMTASYVQRQVVDALTRVPFAAKTGHL